MRRFGQNERSLFGFISSAEPKALQEHALESLETGGHYRLHHLFDYVRNNLLPGIESGSSHTHWGVIDAVLSSSRASSGAEEQILKTVALLTLLDTPELPATEDVLSLSVAAPGGPSTASVAAGVKALRERGLLYERGVIKGLCLWPDTSVNLDETLANALEATRQEGSDFSRLCGRVRLDHIVPRQHYVNTGTLRYAQAQLVPASQLDALLQHQPVLDGSGPDLFLRILLPEDATQKRQAIHTLQSNHANLNNGLLVAVADPAPTASTAFADLLAWEFMLFKAALYRAILARPRLPVRQNTNLMVVLDEFNRLINGNDFEGSEHVTMEAARSSRVSFVLSAQNLSGLEASAGSLIVEKLTALTCNLIFLANSCSATGRLAERCLGSRKRMERHRSQIAELPPPLLIPERQTGGHTSSETALLVPIVEPRVTASKLARLKPGEGFCKLVDGSVHRLKCTFD